MTTYMDQDEVERRLDRVTKRITPIVPKVSKVQDYEEAGRFDDWPVELLRRVLFADYLKKTGRIRS